MQSASGKSEKKVSRPKLIKIEKNQVEKSKPQPQVKYNSEDIIFSLDIGTRTVVGIVGVQEEEKFRVLGAEVVEHKNRAMLDGQIHDIATVANVSRAVKEKLEKDTGLTLTKVAIAAAGRVLKTCEIKVEREIEQGKEITSNQISSIEMEGIQQAQMLLDDEASKNEKTQFYCVGYSVINYYLNNFVISSLLGHKGKKIGADILATFLPHIVVDSLYTVMNKIGLEVVSLTLEPIAAINVTIPKDLRLLNLALVDIGAGTSDIALTRDGSVVAYAMAPVAGDEITEKIAQHYLVDFNTSEKIKIALSSKNTEVTFVDILGKKHSIKVEEVLEVISSTIKNLAEIISNKIIEYNHKAPNAVFLIGGGSQIPGLTDMMADFLKISKDRVVVRGREIIQNIIYSGKKLMGPEAITPFGIAITAIMQKGQDFLSVTINGKKIRLFNSRKLTVADALVLIGFNPEQLIGRSGKSITFTINSEKKVVRGEFGKAAEIFVNGNISSLDEVLKIGDNITVIPAENGKNAQAIIKDYLKNKNNYKIILNGSVIDINSRVFINGQVVSYDSEIRDGDALALIEVITLKDLLSFKEINIEENDLLVNNIEVTLDYILQNDDNVITRPKDVSSEIKVEIENKLEINFAKSVDDTSNTKIIETKAINKGIKVIINNKEVHINEDKSQHMFVDVFNFINFDLSLPQGNIILKLNGLQAGFTDEIKEGDNIEIYWERQSF